MTPEQVANAVQVASAARRTANPTGEHVSLGGGLRLVLFLLVWGLFTGGSFLVGLAAGGAMGATAFATVGAAIGFVIGAYVSRVIRVAAEWEQGVVLRLGKFHRMSKPGVVLVFPVLDFVRFVDTRLLTLDIPHQQVITKDNVPVMVDGVLFFRVQDPERAVLSVQDFRYAISQYAQASLRDVIGSMSLDSLLSERDEIQDRIGEVVELRTKEWGIHVDSIRLLDINMPEDLKRMMSRQASAEREKRATITKAEGDRDAAVNLATAAMTMAASPGAMQLRALQTLDGLGGSPSNTVVLAVPVEILQVAQRLAGVDDPVGAVVAALTPKPEPPAAKASTLSDTIVPDE